LTYIDENSISTLNTKGGDDKMSEKKEGRYFKAPKAPPSKETKENTPKPKK
jgi:hypothetical protein